MCSSDLFDAAQDAQEELVFCAHSVDEVFLDFFGDGHGFNIAEEKKEKRITQRTQRTQSSLRKNGKRGFDTVRVARYR